MDVCLNINEPELTALLIAPDRQLAEEFMSTLLQSRAFRIISELKSYPSQQALEIRLRQVRPDVVFVDVASNAEAAGEVIQFVAASGQPVQAVGLDRRNEPDVMLNALRMGASEFLHGPFDAATQHQAVARLRRLRQPESTVSAQPGVIAVFSSVKPGSGASTIAAQTAFALRRTSGKRVLLADFDLAGGTIGFHLKLNHPTSVLDALANADQLSADLWSSFVSESGGVDVLCAPEAPHLGPIDSIRLHAVMEYARLNYDWVVIDLPLIFQRLSLMALSNADRAFLISTSELPSLHLARKAIRLLEQLNFPRDRFQMLINRTQKRGEMGSLEITKLFNCPVHSRLPNDFFSVNRAITLGLPVDSQCELGKAIDALAARLCGKAVEPKSKTAAPEARAHLAQV
jgi:pilus assembly protein CpaE